MQNSQSSVTTVPDGGGQDVAGASYVLYLVNRAGLRVMALPRTGSIVVGRGDDVDVRVADPRMSRMHVRIDLGALEVEDLGSANGTEVGGYRMSSREIWSFVPGEAIAIGETTLLVCEVSGAVAGDDATAIPPFVSDRLSDGEAGAGIGRSRTEPSFDVGGPAALRREPCPPVRSARRPVILFVAANPHGTTALELAEECEAIEEALSDTPGRDDFEFRSKWAVSIDDLMEHLNKLKPAIIHFSGHGSCGAVMATPDVQLAATRDVSVALGAPRGAGIELQGDDRNPQYVTAHALTGMVKSADAAARVVVLNACFSDEMAESLRTAVDCVIGLPGAIRDESARSFAVGFYRALGYRQPIANCVEQGRVTLAAKGAAEGELPVCRARDGVDPGQLLLVSVERG